MKRYDAVTLEAKWQTRWEKDRLHEARDFDPRPKFYFLTMYPYPSGDLHIGHWYAMAPSDAAARWRRMQGNNVLFPIGFDAFGLPAENAGRPDRKSTRLNSSHDQISYAVFCLKKKIQAAPCLPTLPAQYTPHSTKHRPLT